MKALLVAVMLFWLPGYGIAMPQDDTEAPPIKVVNATQDQAIAERLRAITTSITGMEHIEINVQAGVLTLSGEIGNTQLKWATWHPALMSLLIWWPIRSSD